MGYVKTALVLLPLFIFLLIVCGKNREKNKKGTVLLWAIIWSLILLFIFLGSVCVFANYSLKDPGEDLSVADWLSFFGSYIGFAGSLIMAYVVYRQDKTINQLTLQEYQTAFEITFVNAESCESYNDEQRYKVMIYEGSKLYIKHDICPEGYGWPPPSATVPYLLVEIKNIGRMPVTALVLESVTFSEMPNQNYEKTLFFEKRRLGGNIMNGNYTLEPTSLVQCAFYFHGFDLPAGNYSAVMKMGYNANGIESQYEYTFVTTVTDCVEYKEYRFLDAKKQPTCLVPRVG